MTEEQQKCSRAMMKLFSHTPVKPIPRPKVGSCFPFCEVQVILMSLRGKRESCSSVSQLQVVDSRCLIFIL